MSQGYIEDEDNIVYHVYSEFQEFLYAVCSYHTSKDARLKNVLLTCIRVHMRLLDDFFNCKGGSDDIKCCDMIEAPIRCDIDSNLRKTWNKGTMHLSKQRAENKLEYDDTKFFNCMKAIIYAIKEFDEIIDEQIVAERRDDFNKFSNQSSLYEIRKDVEKLLVDAADTLVQNAK